MNGAHAFCVVCDGTADARTLPILVAGTLVDAIGWLDPEQVEYVVQFLGLVPNETCWQWRQVGPANRGRPRPFRVHGHFDGDPAAPYARVARLALLQLQASDQPPEVALLIIDTDGDLGRLVGLEQARESGVWAFSVVIGGAHCIREAWLLAGFQPRTPQETHRLDELRAELGFDPCVQSQRLSAADEGARRNPKRALLVLTGGDVARENECASAPLDLLVERGQANGLAAFIAEVRQNAASVVG